MEPDAEEWLDDWADRHIQVAEFHRNKHAMASEAAALTQLLRVSLTDY